MSSVPIYDRIADFVASTLLSWLFSCFFIALIGYGLWDCWEFKLYGKRTAALIETANMSSQANFDMTLVGPTQSTNYSLNLYYRYRVSSTEYQGRRYAVFKQVFSENEARRLASYYKNKNDNRIAIWYLPHNPSKSTIYIIEKGSGTWFVLLHVVVVLCVYLGVRVPWISYRKNFCRTEA